MSYILIIIKLIVFTNSLNIFSNHIVFNSPYSKKESNSIPKQFLADEIDLKGSSVKSSVMGNINTENLEKTINELIQNQSKLYNPYRMAILKIVNCFDSNLKLLNSTRKNAEDLLCKNIDKFTMNILTNYTSANYSMYDLEYSTLGNSLLFSSFIFLKKYGIKVDNTYFDEFMNMLIDLENIYISDNPYYNKVHVAGMLHKLIVLTENFPFVKGGINKMTRKEIFLVLIRVLISELTKSDSFYINELKSKDIQNQDLNQSKQYNDIVAYNTIIKLIKKHKLDSLLLNDLNDLLDNGFLFSSPVNSLEKEIIKEYEDSLKATDSFANVNELINVLSKAVFLNDAHCDKSINQNNVSYNNNFIKEIVLLSIDKMIHMPKRTSYGNIFAGEALSYLQNHSEEINIIDLCDINKNITAYKDIISKDTKTILQDQTVIAAYTKTFNFINNYKPKI
jgi:hypothetical protein